MGIGVPLLTVFLLLGSWAWGSILLRVIGRFVKADLRESFGPAIQICLGVSVFLFVGGWLIATNMAWGWILLGWHFLGILLESPSWISWIRGKLGIPKCLLLTTGQRLSMWAVYVLVTLCGLGITATQWWNGNDDWPSYVYLAQKVVDTGGMIDPLDFPRILSYGGMTLYQSIFLGYTGTLSIRAFDFVFCPIVVVAMLYEVFKGRRVSRVFLAVFSVLIIVGTGVGTIQNISPHYAVTMLDLAALLILWKSYETESVTVRLVGLSLTGLLTASLLALRPEYAIMPAVAWLGVMLHTREKRINAWLLPPIIGVLALLGWAVALYRSSKTFMYPLMAGTATPGFGMPTHPWSVKQYVDTFAQVLRFNHQGVILVSLVILCGLLLKFQKSQKTFIQLLSIGTAGAIIQLIFIVVLMRGHVLSDYARYQGPTTFAVGILGIIALLMVDGNHLESWVNFRTTLRNPLVTLERRFSMIVSMVLAGTLCMYTLVEFGGVPQAGPLLSMNISATETSFSSNLLNGYKTILSPRDFIDPLDAERDQYREINKFLPNDSKVLAAVEAPGMLDMKKVNVNSLNYPGSNDVPSLSDHSKFLIYLKEHGYSYFLVQSSNAPVLVNSSRNMYQLNQSPLVGADSLIAFMGSHVERFGDVAIMKLYF